MVRRLQLMEPERRGPGARIVEALGRLRDGLLRDNKVLPPALAALALIIFAWLLAGLIIGDPAEEDRVARQAAQPSVAQAPEDGGGSSETPAPNVENRDNDSIDVYESKDPFRELFPPADAGEDPAAEGGDTDADVGDGDDGTESGANSDGSETGSGSDDGSGDTGSGSGGGSGSDQYGDNGDDGFSDQASPDDSGFGDGSGSGDGSGNGSGGNGGSGNGGSGNGGSGGSGGGGSGQYGDGNGNLFDSGGGLGR